MHVVVIGAGVIGVTSAYYLSQIGHSVTVIDRASQVADGASYANGGQLSYSFTDALARPSFLTKVPALLAGNDRGSKVKVRPSLLPWALRFVSQCTNRHANDNTIAVLKAALRSAVLMQELQSTLPLEFSHRAAGKLVLLTQAKDIGAAEDGIRLKAKYGAEIRLVSRDEALDIEPALARFAGSIAAAIYSKQDAVADAYAFTTQMRSWLETNHDVKFLLGNGAEPLRVDNGRVRSVACGNEVIAADATVVCSGAWSRELLQPLGVRPSIYPVRGYSLTLPTTKDSPQVSVTALRERIVYSRINGQVRIAGFADFTGFDTRNDARRIGVLREVAAATAPSAADYHAPDQRQWGGFRALTPDSKPIVGPTRIPGLFLNTGHGMLGWTLACASGEGIAQSIAHSAQ